MDEPTPDEKRWQAPPPKERADPMVRKAVLLLGLPLVPVLIFLLLLLRHDEPTIAVPILLGATAIVLILIAGFIARASRRRIRAPFGFPLRACSRCGGSVGICRRPLTVKELLALVMLLAFGWASMASMRLFSGFPYPWRSLVILWAVGILPVWNGLSLSESHGRIRRCTSCWTPHQVPVEGTWPFWSTYLLSIALYLVIVAVSAGVRLV